MNTFELQLRIDQQRETIGRLQEQIEGRDDRIAKLETEVARLKLSQDEYELLHRCDCCDCLTDAPVDCGDHIQCVTCTNLGNTVKRAEAAEAKLRAVGELPGKWRTLELAERTACPDDPHAMDGDDCADELEALLKEGAL